MEIKNYLWDMEAWGTEYPPTNAEELIEAANDAIEEYAKTLDDYDIDFCEKMDLFCEKLWEQYCETDEVNGVKSIWGTAEEEQEERTMFKLTNRTSEFYQSGEYIIEIVKDNDPDEPMVEMWIGTDTYGLKMSCLGWPLHQPGAKDGHTEWTMEEAVELLLDRADDYKDEFDELMENIEE